MLCTPTPTPWNAAPENCKEQNTCVSGSQAWPQSACAFGWSGLPEYPVPPLKLVCEDWPALSGKLLLCQFIFKQDQGWKG